SRRWRRCRCTPSPPARRLAGRAASMGDLWRWTREPIGLLTEKAAAAPVFELRLWRPAVVGYRPEWNRAILGDLETFRAKSSLSDLTPYLAGGVVHADVP